MVSAGGGNGFDPNFGIIAVVIMDSSSMGVDGRVFTNFRSYGDSVSLGLVSSGVGSVRNMRLRRSSVQYQSSGVDHRGSSSLFVRAAGSLQTAC